MAPIPQDPSFESTLTLLRQPYDFIRQRSQLLQSDVFEARLLLRKTICMTGPEAAGLFYDPHRFMRQGAAPGMVQKTLFGQGGVQGLDDEAHRHRKQLFMGLMTPDRIARLAALAADEWRRYARRWEARDQVVLYDALQELLTRAVCAWADVPLPEAGVPLRTRQLTALFDAAGSVGPRHLWSRFARWRAERWIAGVVAAVRAGRLQPPEGGPLHTVAWHRELNGELLPPKVAAVEVLNLLRPTVAVSVFITFVAHALHENPGSRPALEADDGNYAEAFVQEVRRFYPFFPVATARVRQEFEWRGLSFPHGRRVLLDLYGTDHDPRSWAEPEAFRPERFRQRAENLYDFIPQGGGDHFVNHRCPGEWFTIELMKGALGFLTKGLQYEVPEQDLRIDRARLPALPGSRFVIRRVRALG